jgi:hypothetical protein
VCISLSTITVALLEYVLNIGADPGKSLGSTHKGYIFLPLQWVSYNFPSPDQQVRLLIEYGALVKETYALQLAASWGRVDNIKVLLEAGAEFDGCHRRCLRD